jgi:hypothetical protein
MSAAGLQVWFLLFSVTVFSISSGLKIASFNVQVFGVKKIGNADVLNTIAKVRSSLEFLKVELRLV